MPTIISKQAMTFVSADNSNVEEDEIVIHKRAVIMLTKRRTGVSGDARYNGVILDSISATTNNVGNLSIGADRPAMAMILDAVDNSILLTRIYADGTTEYGGLCGGNVRIKISAANTAVITATIE